jgi:FkbM family methyltransferase
MRLLDTDDMAVMARDRLEESCRRLASPVYMGKGVALCRILGRYKFYVSTQDDGFGANVLLDGYWESWLTRFMARTVRRGELAVDVGANFGYYSLLLADLVGPEGRLYAIEPNPEVASLLERSLLLNGFSARTRLCRVAAGAGEGTATLYVPEREPKNATLFAAAGALPGGRVKVPVASLDRLLGAERPIGFIKIDAEGGEEAIIAGMSRIFKRQRPPMVLEFNAARYADAEGFLGRLAELYGRLRFIDYDGRAVEISSDRVLTEHVGEDWLLFLTAR